MTEELLANSLFEVKCFRRIVLFKVMITAWDNMPVMCKTPMLKSCTVNYRAKKGELHHKLVQIMFPSISLVDLVTIYIFRYR